jgi:threonine dehydratase
VTAERVVRPPTDVDLEAAWRTVAAALVPTPLVASPLAADAWLKLETMQPTGSFKVRGALAALSALPAGERVVAASAGNHGLGIAWAAARLGLQATVVVSEQASPAKIAKLRAQPIELILHGSPDEAEAFAPTLAGPGRTYVSPYNDTIVIAGQGTLGIELDRQVDGPLTVVVPVGGGGLLAGISLWARRRPDVSLVGVEACASLAVSSAVAAGHVVPISYGETLADGLAGNIESGSVTVPMLAGVAFRCVDEAEIRAAMRWLLVDHGLVAEGAGAAAVAAILAGKVAAEGRLVAVVSGRNVTPERYAAAVGEPA